MDRNDFLRRITDNKGKLEPLLASYKELVAKTKGSGENGADRAFTAEETALHVKLGREIQELTNTLNSDRAALRALDAYNLDDDRTAEALNLGDRSRLPQASDEYMEAFLNFGRGGFDAASARTAFANLTTISPSTGGVLIPTELERTIFFEAFALSPLLSLSSVVFTSVLHDQVPFMGTIGVLAPRKEAEAYLKTEPGLSVKQIDIYNYGGMFPVSQELLEDAPQLNAAFGEIWGNAYAETVEEYGWKGTSGQTAFVNQADGAVTVTLAGRVCPGILSYGTDIVPAVAAASATTIGTDDVIKLKQAVTPRVRGRGTYVMSGEAETKILLLKDGDGRPIWQPTYVAGQPNMLNGAPYEISDRLSAPATGKTSMSYGNFKAHQISIRKGLTVKTSGHYLFGNGMIAIAADTRWGAGIKYAKHIARLNHP